MISGDKQCNFKKICTNVNLIAIFIGIIVFISRFRFPKIISETINSVSKLIGPISMFISGILIAGISLKEVFFNKRVYLISIIRMILLPIFILIVFKASGLSGLICDGKSILLVSFLATITPTASTIIQMAQLYRKDAQYVSAINAVTTIMSVITMPIMVWLYFL